MNKKNIAENIIAQNRKAHHDYKIEQTLEAGIALLGWEVRSLRAGKAQITDSHAILKKGELWMIGAHITPLQNTSTHSVADPIRTRKLLLHKQELRKLIGNIERKGYTLVILKLYWKNNRVKAELGLAKGMKKYDKRAALKQKEWDRQKQRKFKDQ